MTKQEEANLKLTEISVLSNTDPAAAYEVWNSLKELNPDSKHIYLNIGGLLANIGVDLRDEKIILEGITWAESALIHLADHEEVHAKLHYDIGCGYYSLDKLQAIVDRSTFDPVKTFLVQSKLHDHTALRIAEERNEVTPQMHINYANTLSGLGRTLDAVYHYRKALDLDPENPMALGQLGVELAHYARLLHDPLLWLNAATLLDAGCRQGSLEQYGEGQMRQYLEEENRKVQHDIRAVDLLAYSPPSSDPFTSEYLRYIRDNDLFLSLNFSSRYTVPDAIDSVKLPMLYQDKAKPTLEVLRKLLNEIKERFVYARLLLFKSDTQPEELQHYDSITVYKKSKGEDANSLHIAQVKSVFEAAVNIFDKIGLFLDIPRSGYPGGSSRLQPNVVSEERWKKQRESRARTSSTDFGESQLFPLGPLRCEPRSNG